MTADSTNPVSAQRNNDHEARFVLEAVCPTCDVRLNNGHADAALVPQLALEHTSTTGHFVVLNGTTDLPD